MSQEPMVLTKIRTEELQPIQWPAIPTLQPPQSLNDFLATNRLLVFPSDDDRAAARQIGRENIWNFFFRIDPEDVRKIQHAERQKLHDIRRECDQLYQERRDRLEALLRTWQEQRQQRTESIDETRYREQLAELEASIQSQLISFKGQWQKIAGAVLGIAILLTIWNTTSIATARGMPSANVVVGLLISALFWSAFLVAGAVIAYNQTRAGTERGERSRIGRMLAQYKTDQQTEPRLQQELARLNTDYTQRSQQIDERLALMEQAITPIIAQLPVPPADREIVDQLRTDLERLRMDYTRELGLEERLREIVRIEGDDQPPIVVPNPLVFISPGQIQDPTHIPPPYQPPRSLSVAQIVSTVSRHVHDPSELMLLLSQLREAPGQQIRKAVTNVVNRSTATVADSAPTISDRARHLLARRVTTHENRTQLVHGVYYIEYMFIADTMLVHHGFFYDFILNRTTADRTTELFFRDIVSIEKRLEYREIPSRFETEEPLIIEDAPTIRITLPSGDQRTFTFADRGYLEAIAASIGSEAGDVELNPLREAKINADEALRFMSRLLRKHKYSEM
jgi:hypothetical protein